MTRKHYVALAKALASTRPDPRGDSRARDQWTATRDAITAALADSNPLFDQARFEKATEA